jgi:hypothetical protein
VNVRVDVRTGREEDLFDDGEAAADRIGVEAEKVAKNQPEGRGA